MWPELASPWSLGTSRWQHRWPIPGIRDSLWKRLRFPCRRKRSPSSEQCWWSWCWLNRRGKAPGGPHINATASLDSRRALSLIFRGGWSSKRWWRRHCQRSWWSRRRGGTRAATSCSVHFQASTPLKWSKSVRWPQTWALDSSSIRTRTLCRCRGSSLRE